MRGKGQICDKLKPISMENKPTLVDSDVRTADVKKSTNSIYSLKLSSVAVALALTTMSVGITSCVDSDVTTYGDPAADSYDSGAYDLGAFADSYDYGNYDTNDSDVTRYAD